MEGLVVRLRVLARSVIPILRADGWEEADLRAISPAIKAAVTAADEPALRRWCDWLSSKAPAVEKGVAVQPVLPLEMERRHLDREWKERRREEGGAPERPGLYGYSNPRDFARHRGFTGVKRWG